MDELQDTRRARLRQMIQAIGSQAEFIRLTGQNQSEISRLLKDKSFGEKKARAIEQQAGYPAGWLDGDGDSPASVLQQPTRNSSEIPDGYVRLKMFDATPYMGGMGTPVDFPDVVKHIDVLRDHLVMQLGVNPENIGIVQGRGDSMSGTVEHGDLVFVDLTVREFDGDGVYVVVWGHGLVIKRLQGMPAGDILMTSDNKKYRDTHIPAEQTRDMTICGRVVGSWALRRI